MILYVRYAKERMERKKKQILFKKFLICPGNAGKAQAKMKTVFSYPTFETSRGCFSFSFSIFSPFIF